MEAEDFEAAAELSTALDDAARHASAAIGAAREADAACEAASHQRVMVGKSAARVHTCCCALLLPASLPVFNTSSTRQKLKANCKDTVHRPKARLDQRSSHLVHHLLHCMHFKHRRRSSRPWHGNERHRRCSSLLPDSGRRRLP